MSIKIFYHLISVTYMSDVSLQFNVHAWELEVYRKRDQECGAGIGKARSTFIGGSRLRRNLKATISECGLQKRRLNTSPIDPYFYTTLKIENYHVKV